MSKISSTVKMISLYLGTAFPYISWGKKHHSNLAAVMRVMNSGVKLLKKKKKPLPHRKALTDSQSDCFCVCFQKRAKWEKRSAKAERYSVHTTVCLCPRSFLN